MKTTISLAFIFACSLAQAAKVEIKFDTAAEREVWVVDEMPSRMPVAGRAFDTKSIPLEVEDPEAFIVVHEPGIGGVAIRMASTITGLWNVEKSEWTAAEVVVEAFSRGNPLPAGEIEVRASKFEQTSEIAGGKAKFFGVPYGDVEVTVKYKSGGADQASEPQTFRVKRNEDGSPPSFAVTITDNIDAPATTQESKIPEPSWFGRSIVWIGALALGAVALVVLMRFLMGRSDEVEQKLRDLGVPVPGDLGSATSGDEAPAKPFEPEPVVQPGHCAYCGKEETECVCRLDAPRVVSTSHEPEFIGLGVELRIPEGESVIGREGTLSIQDATVSRQHAKVVREGATIVIEDLGSSNGTYVDGVRIEEPTEIKPGSSVHFGSVKVRFEA